MISPRHSAIGLVEISGMSWSRHEPEAGPGGDQREGRPRGSALGVATMTVSALGAGGSGGGREGEVHMDVIAITAVGLVVVISLNLFTVVMGRRDKVGERLGLLERRVARIECHLRVGDVT